VASVETHASEVVAIAREISYHHRCSLVRSLRFSRTEAIIVAALEVSVLFYALQRYKFTLVDVAKATEPWQTLHKLDRIVIGCITASTL